MAVEETPLQVLLASAAKAIDGGVLFAAYPDISDSSLV